VLDTNAVSALMTGDAAVIERLSGVPRQDVGVPQPVLAEIAYGIERLPESRRKDVLRDRFALLRSELRRVDWSDRVTDRFGIVKAQLERAGRRIEDVDAAVAAHALAYGATLVTSNVRHMSRITGLSIENWTR
jgi:tRNA(fMet)-specific endonuclease VapC